MNVTKTIAKNLKLIRKSRKLSQKDVANMLGVTQAVVSCYESEKTVPSVEILYEYAKKFDVSLDFIFGLTDVERGGIMKPEFVQSLSVGAQNIYGNPDGPGGLDIDALKKLIDERIAASKKADDGE